MKMKKVIDIAHMPASTGKKSIQKIMMEKLDREMLRLNMMNQMKAHWQSVSATPYVCAYTYDFTNDKDVFEDVVETDQTNSEKKLPQANIEPEKVNFGIKMQNLFYFPPYTLVVWSDGTWTMVKTHNEPFSKEFGYGMAVLRKVYGGNRSEYLRDIENAPCFGENNEYEK